MFLLSKARHTLLNTLKAIGLMLAAPILSAAAVIHVPGDQATIQAGINSASNGDTVLVAASSYNENINFSGKAITVVSVDGPENTFLQPSSNSVPIVRFVSGETADAELSGFSLVNSNGAPALYILNSSPTVRNNRFGNHASSFQDHSVLRISGEAHPKIVRNLFFDNPYSWGIVWSDADSINFINNTVHSGQRGLVIYSPNSLVENNIVTACGVYGFYNGGHSMTRKYNDIYGNIDDYFGSMPPDPTDLSADARFTSAGTGDFTLQFDSPCINAGDPDPVYNDPDGTRNDIGAYHFDLTPPEPIDFLPDRNALHVPVTGLIQVSFNKDMNEASINNLTFLVRSRSLGLVPGIVGYDSASRTATFDAAMNFEIGDLVTVTATTGMQSSHFINLLHGYIWSFTAAVDSGYGSFIADSLYAVGSAPYAVVAADFDRDGDADLATANFSSNNISILLNHGNGAFAAHTVYAVATGPLSVFAADLDNDGDADLVTSAWTSNQISVLLNDGSGIFAPAASYPVGSTPGFAIAADVNGDGYDDIVTANGYSDNISVLLNNGDGTFTGQSAYPVSNYPRSVVAADLDGDSDLDLATANRDPHCVSVVCNNGDGSFAYRTTYPVGDTPHSICASDLDGDGDVDLAVENENSDDISVLLNKGDATFYTRVDYAIGDGPFSVFTGDFDGDGDLDLAAAVSKSDDVSVLLNHGDGTFTPHVAYPVRGVKPNAVFSADFNNDGMLDMATADRQSGTVTILRNWLIVNHPPTLDSIGPQAVTEGEILAFTVTASDPDEQIPSFTAENLPPGAELDDNHDGTACFEWDVSYGQVGVYSVLFIADDSELTDSEMVEITVNPDPPVVLGVLIDGNFPADHVVDHTPVTAWGYFDPGGDNPQSQFEIAVGTDDDWTAAEMWAPPPFMSADTFVTYGGAELADGEIYHIRLRVHNGVTMSGWYETIFRMNSIPSVPIPINPAGDSVIAVSQPILYVENALDGESDIIVYNFEVYTDSLDPAPLMSASGVLESPDSTGWAVAPALAENQQYFWRACSFDQHEYSPWSPFASFWVNAVQEPPQQFLIVEPGYSGSLIFELLPRFEWLVSVEVDPYDSVYYTLQIATDSNFIFLRENDSLWQTEYLLTESLLFSTRYWWRVKATDNTGLFVFSNNTICFRTWKPGDADADWAINLLDILFLVDYIYGIPTGPAPEPLKTGDINGDCDINLLDILYLISYLYGNPPGPEPVEGCE
ncbi:MAG: VCBS repeat-containing protein [Candidatus Zixiibacteriota bacterium]|nr:MAG: VCBS repeat-containing protein [candidate division Zixibacteria bacterium]